MKNVQFYVSGSLVLALLFVPFGYAMDASSSDEAEQRACRYVLQQISFYEPACVALDDEADADTKVVSALYLLAVQKGDNDFPFLTAHDLLTDSIQKIREIKSHHYRSNPGCYLIKKLIKLDAMLLSCEGYCNEKRQFLMKKQIADQTVLMGALARRMDEAFRSLDQVNGVITRLDHRVENLESYMRRLLADKMAMSK